jgi:hypothetical protein
MILFALLPASQGTAQHGVAPIPKGRYEQIEVGRFEVEDGIDFPPAFMDSINDEIIARLQGTKKFKRVVREGEGEPADGVPAIKLAGRIVSYKPGSRALRYFVGLGAGMTRIVARVQCVDRATGVILYEDDMDGKVILDRKARKESIGATRGLAKEVVNKTVKVFF